MPNFSDRLFVFYPHSDKLSGIEKGFLMGTGKLSGVSLIACGQLFACRAEATLKAT